MKNILKTGFVTAVMAISGLFSSCSDFEPKGYETVPDLDKVNNLKAEVNGLKVNLSWTLPSGDITDVMLIRNADGKNPVSLGPSAISYTVEGAPMGVENLYTVKLKYDDRYVSEGVTIGATLPEKKLEDVSNLKAEVEGRNVTLTWTLPSESDITGVKVYANGDIDAATLYEGQPTTVVLKSQPMGETISYGVAVVYDTYYTSTGVNAEPVTIEEVEAKAAFLLAADSYSDLPDDDERAAAEWFYTRYVVTAKGKFVTPNELPNLNAEEYSVLWIEIDRVGLPLGWENLPSEFSGEATISALRRYTAEGGNLYLANMATQLTVPLNIVPDNMAPTVYGNGDGGSGNDVWVINPYLGWDFRDGSDQGFYDRTTHAIYKGLTFEDPNGYGYENLPLIGPGQREDHNCLWDCNIYGRGNQPDVIKNFEVTTNSLVLATWGHVRDHCVAGLVDFNPNNQHGRCVANGFAAYEWNQNSGRNPYQHNVEKLTENIIEYLK
ncbi:MAG: DUF4960 domain-containing protein [Muribaculaceae bacterium]|nr:DUF4960 domain-containing protein [Muribaculaceae bacterium]